MVHIHNQVTCGKCNSKFCANCHAGCPICGYGKPVVTTASTLSYRRK